MMKGTSLKGNTQQSNILDSQNNMQVGTDQPHLSIGSTVWEQDGPHSDVKTINFGIYNASGLAGKMHRLEDTIKKLKLDFIFVSESWCRPGQSKRLGEGIIFPLESDIKSNGRSHYGQAVIRNVDRTAAEEFILLKEDLSNDKSYTIFRFRGTVFCCCYLKPKESVEWLESKIEEISEYLLLDEPALLVGDLNCRSKMLGDHNSNSYGICLSREMALMDLKRVVPSDGRWTFIGDQQQSVIDHVIGNETACNLSLSCKVWENLFLGGSDHRLVTGSLTDITPRINGPDLPRPWNRWRLKDEAVISEFQEHISQNLDIYHKQLQELPKESTQQWINQASGLFESLVSSALRDTVGLAPPQRNWAHGFMTKELIQAEKVCESHFKVWLRARESASLGEHLHRDVYKSSRRDLDSKIRNRRTEMFNEFATEFSCLEPSEKLRMMGRIRKGKSRGACLLRTDPSSLEKYRLHYEDQFSNNLPEVCSVSPYPERKPEPTRPCPFTFGKIVTAIESLPKGKASGINGMINEALQAAPEILTEALMPIFEWCWKFAIIPDSWKCSRLQPVPKKGDLSVIKNYRPISLTEALRKLFEIMMMPLVVGAAEPLSIEQGGFRLSRGTMDQVAVLQEWISRRKALGQGRSMAFLDIKAAYDQVDRKVLWQKCLAKGMDSHIIDLMKALFEGNSAVVGIGGSQSGTFQMNSGVLQGSPLSPILYSIFIDDIVTAINEASSRTGMTIGGHQLNCLLYADDIVLLGCSVSHLKRMLEACEFHSIQNRYRFGVPKCELVCSERTTDIKLYGDSLDQSPTFTYLGTIFGADGIIWKDHITRMGAKALKAAGSLNSLGCNNGGFTIRTSLELYRSMIRPILEYGLAISPKSVTKEIQKLSNKCQRLMTGTGRNGCAFTTGLFLDLEPMELRRERLGVKFLASIQTKGPSFACYYLLKAQESGSVKNSVISWISPNALIRRRGLLMQRDGKYNANKEWLEFREEKMQKWTLTFKTAFIFHQKNEQARKRLAKNFDKLERADQRNVLNYILGRSIGPWKTCRHCEKEPASKNHVDLCVNRDSPLIEPSQTEVWISNNYSQQDLENAANWIAWLVDKKWEETL